MNSLYSLILKCTGLGCFLRNKKLWVCKQLNHLTTTRGIDFINLQLCL